MLLFCSPAIEATVFSAALSMQYLQFNTCTDIIVQFFLDQVVASILIRFYNFSTYEWLPRTFKRAGAEPAFATNSILANIGASLRTDLGDTESYGNEDEDEGLGTCNGSA